MKCSLEKMVLCFIDMIFGSRLRIKKNMMKKLKGILVCIALVLPLTGCSTKYSAQRAHNNFKNYLHAFVGSNIDTTNMKKRDQLLSTKKLPNGNIEYHYWFRSYPLEPKCIQIFEVDPASRIIVRADFEGSEYSCSITP